MELYEVFKLQLVQGQSLLASLDQPGQPGFILYRDISLPTSTTATTTTDTTSATTTTTSSNIGVSADDNKKTDTTTTALTAAPPVGAGEAAEAATHRKEYVEYTPLLLKQHELPSGELLVMSFPSFNEAVDEYYGQVGG